MRIRAGVIVVAMQESSDPQDGRPDLHRQRRVNGRGGAADAGVEATTNDSAAAERPEDVWNGGQRQQDGDGEPYG